MDAILNNPLYLGIAVVLVIIIAFTVIKKVIKWTALAILIFALYLFFVFKTSDNPEKTIQKHLESGKKQIEKVVDESKDLKKKTEKMIPKDVKKKAKKIIKELDL